MAGAGAWAEVGGGGGVEADRGGDDGLKGDALFDMGAGDETADEAGEDIATSGDTEPRIGDTADERQGAGRAADKGARAFEDGEAVAGEKAEGFETVGFDPGTTEAKEAGGFSGVGGEHTRPLGGWGFGEKGDGIGVDDLGARKSCSADQDGACVGTQCGAEDEDIVAFGVEGFGFGEDNFGWEAVKAGTFGGWA